MSCGAQPVPESGSEASSPGQSRASPRPVGNPLIPSDEIVSAKRSDGSCLTRARDHTSSLRLNVRPDGDPDHLAASARSRYSAVQRGFKNAELELYLVIQREASAFSPSSQAFGTLAN